eukprot:3826025-Lingulodinium_polyedra.AAC.1
MVTEGRYLDWALPVAPFAPMSGTGVSTPGVRPYASLPAEAGITSNTARAALLAARRPSPRSWT